MTEYSIIGAAPVDAFALAALQEKAFSDSFERPWSAADFISSMKTEGTMCFLALKKEKRAEHSKVGYILVRKILDEAEIISFAVDPLYQKQGIGAYLLQYVFDTLTQRGAAKIFLDVREDNTKALHIYNHFGFIECGYRKKYYHLLNGEEKGAKILSVDLTGR